jgi:hypothetical protein
MALAWLLRQLRRVLVFVQLQAAHVVHVSPLGTGSMPVDGAIKGGFERPSG